jgi:hypothetical protein
MRKGEMVLLVVNNYSDRSIDRAYGVADRAHVYAG